MAWQDNPLAKARMDELMRWRKADLVAKALHPVPTIRMAHPPAAQLARWRKDELASSIVAAEFEHDAGPAEPAADDR